MLFTDGPFVTSSDLLVVDPDFTKVATAENIIVDGSSSSVITYALNELGTEVMSCFQNWTGYIVGVGANSNSVAAIMNVLSTAINRPRFLLSQVVAIEPDPTIRDFKKWAEMFCLYNFYRAVFHRRLDDKYEKRMLMWGEEVKRTWRTLKTNGMPVVVSPLNAPGALYYYGSGTWGTGNVSAVSGGSLASPTSFDVAITWTALGYVSPSNQNQCESAGSATITQVCGMNETIQVSINTLNPPNGNMPVAVGSALGVAPVVAATGWNVYVGITGQTLWLQNATPIPVATTTYTLAGAPVIGGNGANPINAGQASSYRFSHQNMAWRA